MLKKNKGISEFKSRQPPMPIKVNANALTIRSTAGTEYSTRGTVIKDAVVLIDRIEQVGSVLWGRLMDKRGWICLTFTEPINLERSENNGSKKED